MRTQNATESTMVDLSFVHVCTVGLRVHTLCRITFCLTGKRIDVDTMYAVKSFDIVAFGSFGYVFKDMKRLVRKFLKIVEGKLNLSCVSIRSKIA